MAKFVISLMGDVVLNGDDMLRLFEILERAERYESVYKPTAEGGSTHHVYTEEKSISLKALPDTVYEVARMAGKPKKD